MRGVFGIVLVLAGAFAVFYASGMDTSVDAGGFGRVHNLSLANEQRNIFIVGALGIIVGAIFIFVAGKDSRDAVGNDNEQIAPSKPTRATKLCPACAEEIMAEAKLCRYCKTGLAD